MGSGTPNGFQSWMSGGVGGVSGYLRSQEQRSIEQVQLSNDGGEASCSVRARVLSSVVAGVLSTLPQYWALIRRSSGCWRVLSNCSWYAASLPKALGSLMGRVKMFGLISANSWLWIATSQNRFVHL